MTADRESLRFYVDESAVGLGKTLCAARKDTIHVGHPLIPECPFGTLDVDWMPAVAARELVVLVREITREGRGPWGYVITEGPPSKLM